MATLVSALAWVKRGAAAENPKKYSADEKELERVSELARVQLEDAKLDLEKAEKVAKEMGVGMEEEDHEEDWEESVCLLILWSDTFYTSMEWSGPVLRAGDNICNSENSDEDAEKNENQMEVDDKPQPKKDPNDLSEYKLDEYDEDNTEQGAHWFPRFRKPFWRSPYA